MFILECLFPILSGALYPVLCKSKSAEHMYHGWHEVRKQLLVLSELTVIELQLILHVHKYECIMATAPVGNTSWPQHQWGIHHGHITSGIYDILSKTIFHGLAVLTQLLDHIPSANDRPCSTYACPSSPYGLLDYTWYDRWLPEIGRNSSLTDGTVESTDQHVSGSPQPSRRLASKLDQFFYYTSVVGCGCTMWSTTSTTSNIPSATTLASMFLRGLVPVHVIVRIDL